MDKTHNEDLRVCFPKWFIIFYTFCTLGIIFFLVEYIFSLFNKGFSSSEMLKFLLFLGIVLGGFWLFLKLLFYSIITTEKGLVTKNLFGSSKSLLWDEIIEVRRPRFGIPADATYVLSSNKNKLLLVRSMNNYKVLIQLIKEKAPNLKACKYVQRKLFFPINENYFSPSTKIIFPHQRELFFPINENYFSASCKAFLNFSVG